jgi:hypothetical protein
MFKHVTAAIFAASKSEYARHGGAVALAASAYHYDSVWGAIGALGTFFALKP